MNKYVSLIDKSLRLCLECILIPVHVGLLAVTLPLEVTATRPTGINTLNITSVDIMRWVPHPVLYILASLQIFNDVALVVAYN